MFQIFNTEWKAWILRNCRRIHLACLLVLVGLFAGSCQTSIRPTSSITPTPITPAPIPTTPITISTRHGFPALIRLTVTLADTDGDGLTDVVEQQLGTDPNNPDTDNDSLSDGDEHNIHHTDPLMMDTDGDLYPDGFEVGARSQGFDPLVPNGNIATNDTDGDGLSDLEEFRHNTNPLSSDTDGDGVNDYDEVMNGSDPNDPTDRGIPPPPDEFVAIWLEVGDPSGSRSERYNLNVGPISHQAPVHGQMSRVLYPRTFRKGQTYPVSLVHTGTLNGQFDFDWLATITPDDPTACIAIDDPHSILGFHSSNPPAPFAAAGKLAYLHIPRVDIVAHWPGTMASPGDPVDEQDEDDHEFLAVGVNDDNDNLDDFVDNDRASSPTIVPEDDEISTVTIRKVGVNEGTLKLSSPSPGLRIFNKTGDQILTLPITVDLANPSGPLADVVNSNVTLLLEADSPQDDALLLLEHFHGGYLTCKDEVHFDVLESPEVVTTVSLGSVQLGDAERIHGAWYYAGAIDANHPQFILIRPPARLNMANPRVGATTEILGQGEVDMARLNNRSIARIATALNNSHNAINLIIRNLNTTLVAEGNRPLPEYPQVTAAEVLAELVAKTGIAQADLISGNYFITSIANPLNQEGRYFLDFYRDLAALRKFSSNSFLLHDFRITALDGLRKHDGTAVASYKSEDNAGRIYANRTSSNTRVDDKQYIEAEATITRIPGVRIRPTARVRWELEDTDDTSDSTAGLTAAAKALLDPNGNTGNDNEGDVESGMAVNHYFESLPNFAIIAGSLGPANVTKGNVDGHAETPLVNFQSKVRIHVSDVSGDNFVLKCFFKWSPTIQLSGGDRTGNMTVWKNLDVEYGKMNAAANLDTNELKHCMNSSFVELNIQAPTNEPNVNYFDMIPNAAVPAKGRIAGAPTINAYVTANFQHRADKQWRYLCSSQHWNPWFDADINTNPDVTDGTVVLPAPNGPMQAYPPPQPNDVFQIATPPNLPPLTPNGWFLVPTIKPPNNPPIPQQLFGFTIAQVGRDAIKVRTSDFNNAASALNPVNYTNVSAPIPGLVAGQNGRVEELAVYGVTLSYKHVFIFTQTIQNFANLNPAGISSAQLRNISMCHEFVHALGINHLCGNISENSTTACIMQWSGVPVQNAAGGLVWMNIKQGEIKLCPQHIWLVRKADAY